MRRALLFFSLLGTVAFAGGWLLSYLQPLRVERAARELIRIEVQAQVERKLDALDDSRIGVLAQQACAPPTSRSIAANSARTLLPRSPTCFGPIANAAGDLRKA
jgi:hypothetical protein